MIYWNKLFSNANVEKQVNILYDTIFNIFSIFVRIKLITVDDRDPSWKNKNIKCNKKLNIFQQYLKNGTKITDFEIVDKEVKKRMWKEKYFYDLSLILNNPQTSPETYWSIIK